MGIVNMIVPFWKRELLSHLQPKWTAIILWKMDIRGAYTLLSFDPADAYLFGMELPDDLLIFFLPMWCIWMELHSFRLPGVELRLLHM